MNSYSENFDQVYISGSFNNWAGDSNPLADPDFDGIWEGTINVTNGAYEYKITLDNWLGQEQFEGFEECTRRDMSGQFVNRLLLVSGDADVPEFCFNSCYDCGQEVKITIRLGMGEVEPSPDGVWLAGGGNFDVPGGKYKMNDDDGDEVYEITVPRSMGFSSFYAFANGNCPDYSCKEDLTGLECGDPNNFNDRFLPVTEADVVVETCFGLCSTNTECTVSTTALQKDDSVFELYGNPPGSGFSSLRFGADLNSNRTVSITNALGQVTHTWLIQDGVESFNLPTHELMQGVYFITVTSGNRFFTRKLMN